LSNPLSLLPIALAAGGGQIDGLPAPRAVAAGFTLLQRSAPLVRAMAGRRSAILLPPSAAVLTALAASDGRGAALLPAFADRDTIAAMLREADAGAVFTTRALAAHLPRHPLAVVLLDDAPRTATVCVGGSEQRVDLGSHFGLDLEGEEDEGRDEECLISFATAAAERPRGVVFTHRNLLALGRSAVDATSLVKGDHVLAILPPVNLAGFALTMAGPLLAGARVTTMPRFDASSVLEQLEHHGLTHLVGDPATFAAIAEGIERRGAALNAAGLRVCACYGHHAAAGLHERWLRATGVELRDASGLPEAPLLMFNAPHFPNRPGTLGVPFPGLQVSVRHAISGDPVAHGDPGVLWARGAAIFSGYLRPDEPGLALRDGWLQTTERVRVRPDGAFEHAE
jgi:long-subunit acyl-CoA synthetase (AMP-forming)